MTETTLDTLDFYQSVMATINMETLWRPDDTHDTSQIVVFIQYNHSPMKYITRVKAVNVHLK